ncbi:MAG: hypothetical protein U5R49_14175 [Deltaproteobacteria bacterium]|nr:hypothetical protein [Deltaproteobacteria bacterium]
MQQFNKGKNRKKAFFYSKGVTYFTKKTERTLFFILTLIMLVWGVVIKSGF